MERNFRVSAVQDDLEFAERSPEPSPPRNSSMMPPFRRPAPPPPPATAASGPPRRSLGDLLPRRSLLAPEVRPSDEDFAKGRDSDERKSDVEPEKDKRDRRPRKKRRSSILSELRPVEGPESAMPSVPAINDDDSQVSDDPLDSGERAKEAFAAQRVRMKKTRCPDVQIYMKNAHPLFGICAAHRHHPYKRGDRFLVLLVALLVALLLCGLFAIRDCCTEVLDVPVAVVNRRLEITQNGAHNEISGVRASYWRPSRRTTVISGLTKVEADELQCGAFYADCSDDSVICAEGSTCRSVESDGDDKNSSDAMRCVPDEMSSQCVGGSCPTGRKCNQSINLCTPGSNYMCYLPTTRSTEERTSIQLTAEPDDTFTAIEAIFQILEIAANNQEENMRQQNSTSASTSTSKDQNSPQSPSPTAPSSTSTLPTTLAPKTFSPSAGSSDSGSNSSSSSDNSSAASSASTSHENSISSSDSRALSNSTSESQTSESSSVKVSITEPVNSAVYSLSSTILVEWYVTLLSGPDLGFDHFRVDFSPDDGTFDTIALNVSTSSSEDGNSTIFQFEWDLADNSSWLCTTCVLRICALDVESASADNFCIRSDGKIGNNTSSRRLQSTVEGSGSGDVVTFRIVREAFECSCGLGHASFLLAAVIIGACIPVVVLLAEPLVTFYRDHQVFGLFARRDGPVRPVIAGYTAKSATRKGRVVLILVLLALCVACGFVAAQITTTNFLTQKGDIVVLWIVVFAIAVALGVLVYCTLMWFVLFNLRWWREHSRERREPSGLSEFRTSLLSDNINANNVSITSPTSPGCTVRGRGE